MKQAIRALPLAMLLAARANAQTSTTTAGLLTSGTVTSFFSICPTATSVTVTVSTTTTICPGPNCGGTTTRFYSANPVTTVGPDGRTTVWEDWTYTAPCPCDGGICDAVYTITRGCPCTAAPQPTDVPSGFTTTAVACHVCAENGGPSVVTVTTPIPNGPWATQTPVYGAPHNGAYASAAASAYASAGPWGVVASAGANAVASAGNGYAAASANGSAYASGDNGNAVAAASAVASVAGSAYTTIYTPNVNTNTSSLPVISTYKGAANRAVYAVSAIAASIVGGLALML